MDNDIEIDKNIIIEDSLIILNNLKNKNMSILYNVYYFLLLVLIK
jgi:hypothetical protein